MLHHLYLHLHLHLHSSLSAESASVHLCPEFYACVQGASRLQTTLQPAVTGGPTSTARMGVAGSVAGSVAVSVGGGPS